MSPVLAGSRLIKLRAEGVQVNNTHGTHAKNNTSCNVPSNVDLKLNSSLLILTDSMCARIQRTSIGFLKVAGDGFGIVVSTAKHDMVDDIDAVDIVAAIVV